MSIILSFLPFIFPLKKSLLIGGGGTKYTFLGGPPQNMLICMQMKKKKLYMSGVPYLAPTRTFVGAEGVENGENANFLIFTPNLVSFFIFLNF